MWESVKQSIPGGGELEGEKYCPADESTTCTGKGQTVPELFWFLFFIKSTMYPLDFVYA